MQQQFLSFFGCRYQGSPFANKVNLLLTIRKIPYFTVLVNLIPPRPELELLGIDYRRVPVLAINDTVYCDTFKIAEAIESIYPDSDDHPSIYPKLRFLSQDHHHLKGHLSLIERQFKVLQDVCIQFWTDRALFQLSLGLIPWEKLPEAFIQDREKYIGHKIDFEDLKKTRPISISNLRAQLELLGGLLSLKEEEEEEEDDQVFLFSGSKDYPSFLDVSIYVILELIFTIGGDESKSLKAQIFGTIDGNRSPQRIEKWFDSIRAFQQEHKLDGPSTVISADEANRKISERGELQNDLKDKIAKGPLTTDEKIYGLGEEVKVVPDDTGKVATIGRLIEIDTRSIILLVERRDGTGRSCRVCFPRLGFKILNRDQQDRVKL
ncbi:hypothetical protein BY996DRAFT_6414978 [Phakopsora pachyrhizi]|nr:hypothetical protein BY996DRAFT_6414978 [Phakopsora pachyrhizi]